MEAESFRAFQKCLRKRAKILSESTLVYEVRKIEARLRLEMAAALEEQHLCMTHNLWTDPSCRTFMSTTYALIDASWKMWAISPYCSIHEGNTTGEDLASFTENVMTTNGQVGRVTAVITECEPFMVKAARVLEDKGIAAHVACAGHWLQSCALRMFASAAVSESLDRMRIAIARYKTCSQAKERLRQTCLSCNIEPKQVLEDVYHRWSSTYDSVDRLLYLKRAIESYEVVEGVDATLQKLDWAILEKLHRLLEPLSVLHKVFEGDQYVTGSLVIPLVKDLRDNTVTAANVCAPAVNPAADASVSELERNTREAIRPCVSVLLRDINALWGDGTQITNFREGPRRQPLGFTRLQVLAQVCDPRLHENLHGIPPEEHDAVWKILEAELTEVALKAAAKHRAQQADACSAAASATVPDAGRGGGAGGSASSMSPLGGLFAVSRSSGQAATGAARPGVSAEAEDVRIRFGVQVEVRRLFCGTLGTQQLHYTSCSPLWLFWLLSFVCFCRSILP